MNDRADRFTEILIEAVINASAGRATTEAACILCGHGVPLETALRVLTDPERRRDILLKRSAAGRT